MKNLWSIDRLLKHVHVLQLRTGKNQSTPLYSETKKVKTFRTKKCKNNKMCTCL